MTVRSATALVTVNGDIPLGLDGAAHLFVDPVNGSDLNTGLTSTTAFATINRAVERMNEYLATNNDADLIIELANGTYAEDVKVILDFIPEGRVFFRGDSTAMTVLASGTLTAATAQLLTDAGAAFGATNDFAGLLVEVFDPLSPATTLQQKTIRNHTGTTIIPVGPFSPLPLAGWSYRILTPAANIVGQGTGVIGQNPALEVVCPWTSAFDGTFQWPGSGPMLGFMFIRITSAASSHAITQDGGQVWWTGIVVDGGGGGMLVLQGVAGMYGSFTGVDDPVYGSTPTYSPNIDACVGARNTGAFFYGLRVDLQGQVFGTFVSFGQDIFLLGGKVAFIGGAIHGALFDAADKSEVQIFGGGNEAFDPLLPFLVRAAPGVGIRIREGSRAEIVDTRFLSCIAGAFAVNSAAFLRLLPTITAGAGDVPGVGVWCQDAGKAAVGSGVTFTTTGANLRVGDGVDADGDSTFAALTLTAPLIDHPNDNGRGAAGVQPGSLASIWEV